MLPLVIQQKSEEREASSCANCNELAEVIQYHYQQGFTELISNTESQGCIIVPNTNRLFRMRVGYFDLEGFHGHRLFNAFGEVAENLVKYFVDFPELFLLHKDQSLFSQLATTPLWLCTKNQGLLT